VQSAHLTCTVHVHRTRTSYTYIVHVHRTRTSYTYIVHVHRTRTLYTYIVHVHCTRTLYTYIVHISKNISKAHVSITEIVHYLSLSQNLNKISSELYAISVTRECGCQLKKDWEKRKKIRTYIHIYTYTGIYRYNNALLNNVFLRIKIIFG